MSESPLNEPTQDDLPPPLPPPVLSYASPIGFDAGGQWRDGAILVTFKGAPFAPVCIKCGEPAEKWWKKTIYWHHPALALMILFPGLIIYAIVAMIVRKNIKVNVGLCRAHVVKRRKAILITWIVSLISIGMVIGGIAWMANASRGDEFYGVFGLLGGILGFIVAVIYAGQCVTVVRAKKIDDHYAWLKGAGSGYLMNLPAIGSH